MHRYNFPTEILLGAGTRAEVAARLHSAGCRRPLIVTDGFLGGSDLLADLRSNMTAAGLTVTVFDGVHPNPIEEDCEAGSRLYREADCDSLVALGGGSVIDLAKALKVLATHPGPISRYEESRGGDSLITGEMPILIALPTTAGTGSEVGRSAVIILRETGVKSIIFHPKLIPELAVLDPELSAGLPPLLTAATGMDALTHCIEAYFAPGFHPICDGIAIEGIRLILAHLEAAVADGTDLVARERMLIGAAMGAIAFQKGLGMTHSLAHPLSAEYGMHHGLANALLLPASASHIQAAALNADQRQRVDQVAAMLAAAGYANGNLGQSLSMLVRAIGITQGLDNHGIPRDALPRLARLAFEDGIHQTNMVPVTTDDLLEVYGASCSA